VTGYLVTESSTEPQPDALGWESDAPNHHTFSNSGPKTLYGWAKDAAGNVSSGKSSHTTIEITGPDLSGMTLWEGAWFRVNIKNAADGWVGNGYLNILAWEEGSNTLRASLFTQDEDGQWQSADLPLHYTSGTPLRFLCSFDYAENFAFSVSIVAKIDKNGNLRNAIIKAVGLTYDEEDVVESETDVRQSYSMVGILISDRQVPAGIDVPGSDGHADNSRVRPKRWSSRTNESGSKFKRMDD
jgi:hypothetical protein